MVTRARDSWLLATALLACSGEPAGDTGAATSTATATDPDTTADPPPTTGASATTTTGDLPTSATLPGDTTDDPPTTLPADTTAATAVDTGTDTGASGLACPLADGPGVTVLALAPQLYNDGADPSDAPACTELLKNPERGFHGFVDLRDLGPGDLEDQIEAGRTLVYGKIYIPEFRDAPLDQALLDDLGAAFDLVREHGMKVTPRFHYSDDVGEADAELDRILAHIDQVAPLLLDHADVIVHLQAGFIGAYGEWHSSTNGLDAPGPRKQILGALLAALPEDRMISVRRPSFKADAYAGPLTDADAHDGSDRARIGHLNDCFLASDDDYGTYQEPGEKDYIIEDSPYVVVSGETCAVNPPRSECPTARDELALLHWTHINAAYHPGVLESWQTDGCYAEIACRLGYRLAVTALRHPDGVAPGDNLPVSFEVFNDGYAAPINPRPFNIVLDGPTRIETPADFDVRALLPGETSTICIDTPLPVDLPPGDYRLGLRLADPAPTLIDDPRQAIRLANDIEWTDGINWFDATITIN